MCQSSQRKRRAISPLAQQEQPSSSKRKRSKRKLAFDKAEDAPAEGNLLNLPYSDSDLDSGNSDSEDQDESESMFEDHAQILWTSLAETIEKIDDIGVIA
jgi:hypothetical protein